MSTIKTDYILDANGTGAPTFTNGATFTNGVVLPAGSAAGPAISPTSDTNTGVFFPAADTVAIATGGTERMRVDSSGNVGIGTTTPSTQLEVVGNIKDTLGPVRAAPIQTKTGAYVVAATDAGTTIYISTGGVTIRRSVLSAGDMITIVNNSVSNQIIAAGVDVTFRLAGTATTGERTLAQYGMATFLCVVGGATPTFHCSGAGLT